MALINGARIITKVFESFGIEQTFTLSSGHPVLRHWQPGQRLDALPAVRLLHFWSAWG